MTARRLKVIVEADGGARGNPGPAGYGAVVRAADTGEILVERAEPIGVATNNVAEYSGLIAGLAAAAEVGAVEVEVRMDSKLVVEQMSGRWQIKNQGLRPLAARAATLARQFDTVTFEWIPRASNAHADMLANEAMDGTAGTRVIGSGSAPGSASGGSGSASAASVASASASASASKSAGSAGSAPRSWAPPDTPATRLILVRHGETGLNRQARYSGRGDVELSPVGQAQARATAARVAALAPAVTAVVTSPLSRCTRTARLIADAAGADVPVTVDEDLIECDFGAWEGLTFAEVRERWPAELDAWLGDPAVAPPDGESFHQVAKRAARAVGRLRERRPGDTVVMVSHVSPIKLMLRDALAATDAMLHRLYLDPCGLSIVDFWPDGGLAVRAVNDTAHL